MSEPEIDWSEVTAERYFKLWYVDKNRWIESVHDVSRFDEAIRLSILYGDSKTKKTMEEAKDRLILRQDGLQTHQRHQESLAVDRSARNIGGWALVVGCLALGVAVFATPQVQRLISTPPTQQSPSSSAFSPDVGSTLAPHPSSGSFTTSSNPTQAKPEPKPSTDTPTRVTTPEDLPPSPPK